MNASPGRVGRSKREQARVAGSKTVSEPTKWWGLPSMEPLPPFQVECTK
jgi:hypothetical protein